MHPREGAPPWRVPARIAYASSRMQPSPVSTPFPSCAFPFALPLASLLSIFIFPPAAAPSLFILHFALLSRPSRRRVPSFSPLRVHRRLSSVLFFSHIHPRPNNSPRLVPFRTFTFAAAKLYPILRIIPAVIYRTIYIYVCEWRRGSGREAHAVYS